MKNQNQNVEIYEVPTEEDLEVRIYGTYEERKKWTIESMDEEILEYFNKKTFNGGFRYFLSAENTVAIAYETPVKFHKYDSESGSNVFDLGNSHVITFSKEIWREWARQNSIWIDLENSIICAQQQMLETFLKILKINGLSMSIQDKKAKVLKFDAEKTAKELRF